MKIRTGFVSNSSSSSFVIHRSYLTDEQVDALQALYEKCSSEDYGNDRIYDDDGEYFERDVHYVSWNAYGTPQEWRDFLTNLNLPKGAIRCVHEG